MAYLPFLKKIIPIASQYLKYIQVQTRIMLTETPHVKKYKSATNDMVKFLELTEAVPVILGTKTK